MNKPIFYTTKEEQETHILATKIRLKLWNRVATVRTHH